jgi:hypothetical protein
VVAVNPYWKPIPRERATGGPNEKQLGHGIYALWGRCDACSWSGPWRECVAMYKSNAQSVICDPCWRSADIGALMRAEGWHRV